MGFNINQASPVFLLIISATFLLIIQKVFDPETLASWGFSMQAKAIEVDEDLPDFFETVKLSMADELLLEESNMKMHYNFSYNDADTIEELVNSKNPKRPIQGTPWYSILSNAKYKNLFAFQGANVDERFKIIEDGSPDEKDKDGNTIYDEKSIRRRCEQSDLVVVLLNLSYIPDGVVKAITNFEAGWSTQFKELMDKHNSQFTIAQAKLNEYIAEAKKKHPRDYMHMASMKFNGYLE